MSVAVLSLVPVHGTRAIRQQTCDISQYSVYLQCNKPLENISCYTVPERERDCPAHAQYNDVMNHTPAQ